MRYILPDLFTNCSFTFSQNPLYSRVGPESAAWIDEYHVFSNQKRQDLIHSCSEMLVRNAYPYAPYEQFRICCDFVNLLFVVDEISDEQNGKDAYETGQQFLKTLSGAPCDGSVLSRITNDFTGRLHTTIGTKSFKRFLQLCKQYIEAVSKEAELRERNEIPDFDTYKHLRRENSAVRLCYGLIEQALGIDLPDEVFEDPVFKRMYFAAVDMVSWSNDIYSYDMEQSKGIDGINILTVLMNAMDCTLQEATDHAGRAFNSLIDSYERDKAHLRSWTPEIDSQVQTYIKGMEHWVIGNLHWSFESIRYFGFNGAEMKIKRVVTLRPREEKSPLDPYSIDNESSGTESS